MILIFKEGSFSLEKEEGSAWEYGDLSMTPLKGLLPWASWALRPQGTEALENTFLLLLTRPAAHLEVSTLAQRPLRIFCCYLSVPRRVARGFPGSPSRKKKQLLAPARTLPPSQPSREPPHFHTGAAVSDPRVASPGVNLRNAAITQPCAMSVI